jgi:8-oxo-dGTP diphosphatase
MIAGIGGRLEPGETSEQALQREIHEEVKVHIKRWKLVGRSVNLSPHKPTHNLGVDIYVVSEFDGEPQETDVIAPLWVPKTELPLDRMWPDNRLTAPLVLQGECISGSFLYGPDGKLLQHDLRTLGPHEAIAEL